MNSSALWARCADLEPDDPSLLLALARAELTAGQLVSARETEAKALAHPKLSPPLRAQILVQAGDTAWSLSLTGADLWSPHAITSVAESTFACRLAGVTQWPADPATTGLVLRVAGATVAPGSPVRMGSTYSLTPNAYC